MYLKKLLYSTPGYIYGRKQTEYIHVCKRIEHEDF